VSTPQSRRAAGTQDPAGAALPRGDGRTQAGSDACRRESARLEANKAFAASMLQMSDNPVLAAREYNRFARDLNAAINVHNAMCKSHPVRPLPL
jgi:hypothetical protein